ncbi:MAG TPA: hypothetical protein PK620_10190 [Denitromonas sp.]|nr:hypothetical protein [Denitromonas sp.]HQV15275.1 hypothetical protein [Denitromonas sp.]
MEYPKMLYRSGWSDLNDCVIVYDEAQEDVANESGFVALGSIAEEPEPAEEEQAEAKPRRGRPRKDA